MRSGKPCTIGFLPTLLCLVAMILASCNGSSTTVPTGSTLPAHAPASQQIYRYGDALGTDIPTFDPAQTTDVYSIEALTMVFTGLVSLNDEIGDFFHGYAEIFYGANGYSWGVRAHSLLQLQKKSQKWTFFARA